MERAKASMDCFSWASALLLQPTGVLQVLGGPGPDRTGGPNDTCGDHECVGMA